ncbi:MAG: YifB family Mg chelatase-like AAA ATPase [Firmicutes bacterium]|nr:YifB family Mg chelatase-like AAA ATPase [Bacillota bacterium]
MFYRIHSAAISGLTGVLLEIECYVSGGLPNFTVVGIPPSHGAACRERIRSALKNAGFTLPPSRITINIRSKDQLLTPDTSSLSALDLPVALTILACERQIPTDLLDQAVWLGEFGLDGSIKPLYGALCMTRTAKRDLPSAGSIFLPLDNAPEAALFPGLPVYGISSLQETVDLLRSHHLPKPAVPVQKPAAVHVSGFDLIKGQQLAKRVMTIAAAGMHNMLMIGPPGCGKTMLAHELPALLPPLTYEEKLELTEIYSNSQLLSVSEGMIHDRPFRQPHHSTTSIALIGGGNIPKPGEITLSHHGVLFLDELPEFARSAIESMREPLEEHRVRISRISGTFTYPADFLLAAAMNPCPCGHYPDRDLCHCSETRIKAYYEKIKSPLFDRIDLIVTLKPVTTADIRTQTEFTYQKALELVSTAHQAQEKRFGQKGCYNSRMSTEELEKYAALDEECHLFTEQAMSRYHLSMRGYHKILKVARTLADMEGSEKIRLCDLAEAIQYRSIL